MNRTKNIPPFTKLSLSNEFANKNSKKKKNILNGHVVCLKLKNKDNKWDSLALVHNVIGKITLKS
jgi:hypothetical protein